MENQGKKQVSTAAGFLIIIIALIVGFFVFSGGEGNNTQPTISQPVLQTNKKTDALEMMATVFEGGYSQEQIKEKVDKALTLYNIPINEENYSRTGSMLVAAKKEKGLKEIDILNCMISGHTTGTNITLQQMSALCIVNLK